MQNDGEVPLRTALRNGKELIFDPPQYEYWNRLSYTLQGEPYKIYTKPFSLKSSRVPRNIACDTRLAELIQMASDVLWCIGRQSERKRIIARLFEQEYDAALNWWKTYCFNAIQECLKVTGHPETVVRTPIQASILYRARRAVPYNLDLSEEETLSRVREDYGLPQSVGREGLSGIQIRMAVREMISKVTNVYFAKHPPSVQSTKAALRFTRAEGGFNAGVGMLAEAEGFDLPRPPTGEPLSDTVYGRELANSYFSSAFRLSIEIVKDQLHRGLRPKCFVANIPERGKDRMPGVAETYMQVIARSLGQAGFFFLSKIFPETFTKKQPMKMAKCEIYNSGDYKTSTAPIPFSISRSVYHEIVQVHSDWDVQLKQDLHTCIDFILGPHDMFTSKEERSRIRKEVRGRHLEGEGLKLLIKTGNLGFSRSDSNWDRLRKAGSIARLFNRRTVGATRFWTRGGNPFAQVGDLSPPAKLLTKREAFRIHALPIQGPYITTRCGILMMYGMTQPVLYILNKMSHDIFRKSKLSNMAWAYFSGDDNVSGHHTEESRRGLEEEKLNTGMIPHTNEKTIVSPVGCILCERLFIEGKGKLLKEIPFVPVRTLFPQRWTIDQFVTLPRAAEEILKELDVTTKRRFWSLIYRENARTYRELRKEGVPLFSGNKPLFPFPFGIKDSHPLEPTSPLWYASSYIFNVKTSKTKSIEALETLAKDLAVPCHDFACVQDTRRVPYRTSRTTLNNAAQALSGYTSLPYKEVPMYEYKVSKETVIERWKHYVSPDGIGIRKRQIDRLNTIERKIDWSVGLFAQGIYPLYENISSRDLMVGRTLIVDGFNICTQIRTELDCTQPIHGQWDLVVVTADLALHQCETKVDHVLVIIDTDMGTWFSKSDSNDLPNILLAAPQRKDGTADDDIVYWTKKISSPGTRLCTSDICLQHAFQKIQYLVQGLRYTQKKKKCRKCNKKHINEPLLNVDIPPVPKRRQKWRTPGRRKHR